MSGRNAVYVFNLDWRDSNPTEEGRLNTFIDAVLSRPDVVAAGVRKVVLITDSYGGPVARSYYLNPANNAQQKVDQVISFGGGFLGVVEPLYILEHGSTWGFGIDFGPMYQVGFAEWETKGLAQNWPTAYFQMPNSQDWFFDHGMTINGRTVNRTYIRDYRPRGAGEITTYTGSMAWVGSRHNSGLTRAQMSFFNPPSGPPIGLGDFRNGTGAIYHHRIIGKGRLDTIVATAITQLPSLAASSPEAYGIGVIDPITGTFIGDPVRLLAERQPWPRSEAVYGDGDSTIPYHGALGLTLPADDRVYIMDNARGVSSAKHGDLPKLPEVLGVPGVKGLLQLLLEGTICNQPQAPVPFLSQNDVQEIL
jgi:hypothetical protein